MPEALSVAFQCGEDATTGLILGMGSPSITIEVGVAGSEIVSKTVNAVVLGFIVIITS